MDSAKAEQKRVEKLVQEGSKGVPAKIAPYLEKAAPVLAWVFVAIKTALPYILKFYHECFKIYMILPKNVIKLILGLILCFFGGMYPSLVCACEAARICGWPRTKQALIDLQDEATRIVQKSAKDDKKDDNKDGIADVDQITSKELAMRKASLVMRKCDAQKINDAIGGLLTSWLAIEGVLKMQFAKTIALAVSIGDMIKEPMTKFVAPLAEQVLPQEYHQWIPIAINWTAKGIAVSWAWWIQQVISAVHSAMRGGTMVGKALIKLANEYSEKSGTEIPFLPKDHKETYIDDIVGFVLAAIGVWWQWGQSFSNPFPLNLILWPFGLAEYYIRWHITA